MDLILELKKRPDRPAKACRGVTLERFPDFDFLGDSTSTSARETLVEALDEEQVSQGNVTECSFVARC